MTLAKGFATGYNLFTYWWTSFSLSQTGIEEVALPLQPNQIVSSININMILG